MITCIIPALSFKEQKNFFDYLEYLKIALYLKNMEPVFLSNFILFYFKTYAIIDCLEKRFIGSKMCGALLEKIEKDLTLSKSNSSTDDMHYMLDHSHAEDLQINSLSRFKVLGYIFFIFILTVFLNF
jgi:hypothetical protein